MTSDERIEKLEQRVDRHEDRYITDIQSLHAKVDALVAAVNAAAV